MQEELIEPFLPDGILDWFVLKKVEKNERTVRLTFEEKNIVPQIPEEHRNKKIISKGFKKVIVDDFPIRGRKTELIFLRRIWQFEGVKELLKRDIKLTEKGTKLEKEFATFLKELDRF